MSITRINVGPIHPSTHGVLRIVVDLDGDEIVSAEPHIGFLHRGVEKLMETRMYMVNPPYVEKLDYAAPMGWGDLYVAVVEKALGAEVKERAKYARTILLEFQRIASHLLWLGTFVNDMGQFFTLFMWCFRERAKILKFLENVTGGRMFYVNMRVGGLNRDLPDDFSRRAYELTDYLEEQILQYKDVTESNGVFMERTRGIGKLSKEDAIAYGTTGPVLRGSGVDEDVRKSNPYYVYDRIKFRVQVFGSGDVYARYMVRYYEMLESINIIRQALGDMPDGDVKGAPIRLIGAPAKANEVIESRELARGEGQIYMIPDKQKPYRISLRSPAFSNLAVLPMLVKGEKFADLFPILGSLDVVMAEIDR